MLEDGAMLRQVPIIVQFCIVLAALPACSTAADRPGVPGCRTMECVGVGETQQVWDNVSITPVEVLEDSRCPIEAECVWEGRVRLKAQIDLDDAVSYLTLDSDEPLRISGGSLSFAEIAPDMSTAWAPIRQKDYRFGFRFAPDIMEDADAPTEQ
ncbi:MAG TPA: hypothetical protein DCS24_00825 [Erythrobacter sp.]|nr:hypothetical protein [Erythrobacter sp.]